MLYFHSLRFVCFLHDFNIVIVIRLYVIYNTLTLNFTFTLFVSFTDRANYFVLAFVSRSIHRRKRKCRFPSGERAAIDDSLRPYFCYIYTIVISLVTHMYMLQAMTGEKRLVR